MTINLMISMKEGKYKIILAFIRASALLFLTITAGACSRVEEQNSSGENLNPSQEFESVDIDVDKQIAPAEIPTRGPNPCPGLDSKLTRVYQSAEPINEAQKLQMKTEGEKIQVLLILEGEDSRFLEKYAVEISKQSGNQAQAFVPVEQLCAIASENKVLAIRTIAQMIVDE